MSRTVFRCRATVAELERPYAEVPRHDASNLHDLSDADRKLRLDSAQTAVREASREAVESYKKTRPDPRSHLDYDAWRTMRMVAIVFYKHEDRETGTIKVSRDGSGRRPFYPRPEHLDIQPESNGPMILALFTKLRCEWWSERVPGLCLLGRTQPLTPDVAWTKDDLATWDRLDHYAFSINSRIANSRRKPSIGTRSAFA